MWTHQITNVSKELPDPFIEVTFTNGKEDRIVKFNGVFIEEQLKTVIRNQITYYTEVDAFSVQSGDILDLTLPPPHVPTQKEIDIANYAKKKAEVSSAFADIALFQDLTLKMAAQAKYDALIGELKALPNPN